MKNLKVLAFTNGTGSPWWRFHGQARFLNKNGHEMYVASHKQWNEDTLGADIVIIEMISNPRLIDFCHRKGAKVIFEVDDLIEGDEKRQNLKREEGLVESFYNTVRRADAVTTTTEALAKHLRKVNSNVYVLPNYLDTSWWKKGVRPKRNDKTVRIGWAGGMTHYEDLKMVQPAIKNIIDKYDFVKFIYAGFGGMRGEGLQSQAIWAEDVFSEIPKERREYYHGTDTDWWPDKSRQLDLDVAIAPLIKDQFNACKSNCKWLEYSANKVAGVYSPTVYAKSVEHGVTGFIANNLHEWEHYLETLVLNEEVRDLIAKDAYKEVMKNWTLKKHWRKWLEVYQKVCQSQ